MCSSFSTSRDNYYQLRGNKHRPNTYMVHKVISCIHTIQAHAFLELFKLFHSQARITHKLLVRIQTYDTHCFERRHQMLECKPTN